MGIRTSHLRPRALRGYYLLASLSVYIGLAIALYYVPYWMGIVR